MYIYPYFYMYLSNFSKLRFPAGNTGKRIIAAGRDRSSVYHKTLTNDPGED